MNLGDIVQMPYKSGIYIGELIEDRNDKYLIKILTVEKHPLQGDLHHPKQVDGVLFHERKALSQYEKVNVLKEVVKEYTGHVPEYGESLKSAVERSRDKLNSKDNAYNNHALKALKTVEDNYYIGRYY